MLPFRDVQAFNEGLRGLTTHHPWSIKGLEKVELTLNLNLCKDLQSLNANKRLTKRTFISHTCKLNVLNCVLYSPQIV